MKCAIYTDDGTITSIISGSPTAVAANVKDTQYVEVAPGVDSRTHYILGSTPKEKGEFSLDDSVNGRISRIPKGTKIRWPDGEELVEQSGSISFDANASTEFWFGFTHPRFLNKTLKVTYVTS